MGKELAVPFVLLAVVTSMLLPIPAAALDFLLVSNISLALLLFLSTLYVKDVLALSALPSLLLSATLYRLALNVATTRSILGSGEGGSVVQAFGNVVISGNLVVGLVIFLVITLIQFLVIAKGAERVAEVAARFTLDALPGKQMSIDADVRAGLIDFETARKRRSETQTESRFYGALDGAMKFIKGDAIAGLCITAVNLLGGFAIGMLLEGLSADRAIAKYTLLTIGDGLVSQVPALLNALAAGLVVTRVSRGDDNTLANELSTQIWSVPYARFLTGIVALILGTISGMPSIPFLALGFLLLGSLFVKPKGGATSDTTSLRAFEPKNPPLIGIEVAPALASAVLADNQLFRKIEEFRSSIFRDLGIILPIPEFSRGDGLTDGFRLLLRGVPCCEEKAAADNSITDSIILSLDKVVRSSPEELIDDILTRRTLDYFEKFAPELTASVVPNITSVTQITEILRNLVRDRISIRHFDLILQSLAEHGARVKNDRMLLEEVRIALRRVISHRYQSGSGEIQVVMMDVVLDYQFQKSEREGAALDFELLDWVATELKNEPNGAETTVLLASRSARRLLAECLRMRSVNVPVLAHEEISSDAKLKVVRQIQLPEKMNNVEQLSKLVA